MGLFSRLFSKRSAPSVSAGTAAIQSGKGHFTTGSEEILLPLPQIAFTPPAGWSPFDGVKTPQKETDVRIANPNLLGPGGMITCLLFPADGISVVSRVDGFCNAANFQTVERTERTSAGGVSIHFLHTVSTKPGQTAGGHAMHCFFQNADGQVVDLYCVGSTEASARSVTDAVVRTLRLLEPAQAKEE